MIKRKQLDADEVLGDAPPGAASDAILAAVPLIEVVPPPPPPEAPAATLSGWEPPAVVRPLHRDPAAPVQWLAERLLLAQDLNLLVGPGGVGKSTVALAAAAAVAGGVPAFNTITTRAANVLIVSAEDPADIVCDRLAALVAGHGWDRAAVLGNIAIVDHGVDLSAAPSVAWLTEYCEAHSIGLVVLDPLVRVVGAVDENVNAQAATITGTLRQLARRGTAVLLVHHVAKASAEARSKADRVRGAGEWLNACRLVWSVEKAGASGLKLECIKSNRMRAGATVELELTVTEDPTAPGSWASATLTDATTGDYAVAHRRTITENDRAALGAWGALEEELSYTEWRTRAGIAADTTFRRTRDRLLELGLVAAGDGGRYQGRTRYLYRITPEGRNALLAVAV